MQTATISTYAASSKQAGRCFFRSRYDIGNQGQANAGATTNRIHLDAANGPSLADDALPGLEEQRVSDCSPAPRLVTAEAAAGAEPDLVPGRGVKPVHQRRHQVVHAPAQGHTGGGRRGEPSHPLGADPAHGADQTAVMALHLGEVGEGGLEAQSLRIGGVEARQQPAGDLRQHLATETAAHEAPQALVRFAPPGGPQPVQEEAHLTPGGE